jgi:hypothetical protein
MVASATRNPVTTVQNPTTKARFGGITTRRDDARAAIIERLKAGPCLQSELIAELRGNYNCDFNGILRRMRDTGLIVAERTSSIRNAPMILALPASASTIPAQKPSLVANATIEESKSENEVIEDITDEEITDLIADHAHRAMTVEQVRKSLTMYDPDVLVEKSDWACAVRDIIEQHNVCG